MTEYLSTETDTQAEPFAAGYPEAETRVYRRRLPRSEGGVSTATFRGQIADATTCWVKRGARGISLYAEVTPDDTTATEVRVALVPTGKRAPLGGHRLGSVGGMHVYLLSVDGTVDRAAYDAACAAREAERQAERDALRSTLEGGYDL